MWWRSAGATVAFQPRGAASAGDADADADADADEEPSSTEAARDEKPARSDAIVGSSSSSGVRAPSERSHARHVSPSRVTRSASAVALATGSRAELPGSAASVPRRTATSVGCESSVPSSEAEPAAAVIVKGGVAATARLPLSTAPGTTSETVSGSASA